MPIVVSEEEEEEAGDDRSESQVWLHCKGLDEPGPRVEIYAGGKKASGSL